MNAPNDLGWEVGRDEDPRGSVEGSDDGGTGAGNPTAPLEVRVLRLEDGAACL